MIEGGSRQAAFGIALTVLGAVAVGLPTRAAAECDRIPRCELVWADEFDGSELDGGKWTPQLGDGTAFGLPSGWGNSELQYYQEANATVGDGVLTITAREESVAGFGYTSARLRTLAKGDWRYGRVEMRARLPFGQGLWAAFWMLPSSEIYGGWAASGEIDVMEAVGDEPDTVLGTLHYGSPWPQNSFSGNEYRLTKGGFQDDLHVFAIEWERGEIRWYVDGEHYATQTDWFSSGGPYPAPFDNEFHILLNVAVGGNLPGSPNSTTTFPQEMVVDYVRVYQASAAKGAQVATTGLVFDKAEKMKRIDATLSMPFENQARKRDRAGDRRRVACAALARGTKGFLAVKGSLRLELRGSIGATSWAGGAVKASFDGRGEASFSAEDIERLVDEAAAEGAEIDRFRITFDGAGGKKLVRFDLDCWQLASD